MRSRLWWNLYLRHRSRWQLKLTAQYRGHRWSAWSGRQKPWTHYSRQPDYLRAGDKPSRVCHQWSRHNHAPERRRNRTSHADRLSVPVANFRRQSSWSQRSTSDVKGKMNQDQQIQKSSPICVAAEPYWLTLRGLKARRRWHCSNNLQHSAVQVVISL